MRCGKMQSRGHVAELVDALASGASGATPVEVRVLSCPQRTEARRILAGCCGVWQEGLELSPNRRFGLARSRGREFLAAASAEREART